MRVNAPLIFRVAVVSHFTLGLVVYCFTRRAWGVSFSLTDQAAVAWECIFWLFDIVVAVGLCFFRTWARWLFVAGIALFFASAVVLHRDVVVGSALVTVGFFEYVLAGAIIAMSFLPSVATLFGRKT
jgi:hypothetical protein